MSKIALSSNASGTGVFTIESPNSDTDYTINLPEISGGEFVATDASGKVGIGTSAPSTTLDVKSSGTTSDVIRATNNTGTQDINITQRGTSGWAIKSSLDLDLHADYNDDTSAAASNIRCFTDNIERMRIDASGNLLVGTTSPISTEKLLVKSASGDDVAGCFYRPTSGTTTSLVNFRSDVGGTETATCVIRTNGDLDNTNNSYGALSDARLKSDIVDASSQIDDIMAVQVRSYTLDSTGDTHIGVVAQELEASGMSGLVKTDDEGIKSVKYSILYMKAIKALQEAVTKIEDLESRLSALEAN